MDKNDGAWVCAVDTRTLYDHWSYCKSCVRMARCQALLSVWQLERRGMNRAFDPSLELGKVQEDATVWGLTLDATFHPNPALDLVTDGVFAVAGDFGKSLDEYPAAWVAHGALLTVTTTLAVTKSLWRNCLGGGAPGKPARA